VLQGSAEFHRLCSQPPDSATGARGFWQRKSRGFGIKVAEGKFQAGNLFYNHQLMNILFRVAGFESRFPVPLGRFFCGGTPTSHRKPIE